MRLTMILVLACMCVLPLGSQASTQTPDYMPVRGSVTIGCTWNQTGTTSNNNCPNDYHTSSAKAIDFIVPKDTPVYAAGDGTLSRYGGCDAYKANASCNGGAGNYVVIKHPDGRSSRYLHLAKFAGSTGAVKEGALIGYVGLSGNTSAYHLHYDELNSSGTKVDPGTMYYCADTDSRASVIKMQVKSVSGWTGIAYGTKIYNVPSANRSTCSGTISTGP